MWIWKQFLQDCADTKCELSEKVDTTILSHHSDHLNRRLYDNKDIYTIVRYITYTKASLTRTIANIDHLEHTYQ